MRLNHVALCCADVARSLAFYRGLGLAPIVIEPGADGAPRYARLRAPEGDATLSLEQAEGRAATQGNGAGVAIYFECADLDARTAALAREGYQLAGPPETKPWMWREAELRDPDGHLVRLYQAGSYRLDPPWRLATSPEGPPEPGEDPLAAQLAPFSAGRNRGYADAPIPSARDLQLGAYLEGLIAAGAGAREQVASRLGALYTPTLLAFAERAATRAVRDRDVRPVLQGLVAIGLGWREAADVRPAIPLLGLLYDAAGRAGGEGARLFAEAAALVPPDVAPLFADFLTRPDLDEIADEMGFSAGRDAGGFRYRRSWGTGQVDIDPDGAV